MDIEALPSKRAGTIRVRFNGVIYRRYPNAKGSADRNYFRCGMADKLRGFGLLHRDIWIYHHGAIPAGWEVHHVDGVTTNNAIENLEALAPTRHREHHAPEGRQRSAMAYKQTAGYQLQQRQRAAAEWHGSPEGKAWHCENALQMHAELDLVDKVCEQCGAAYQVCFLHKNRGRFCSPACKTAFRRASEVDHEQRDCVVCGTRFSVSRYSPIRHCSARCAGVAHRKREVRQCRHCPTTFEVRPSERKRFCSLACAYAHRSVTPMD